MGILGKNEEIKRNIEEEKRHRYETLSPTNNSESKETINMLTDFIESKDITNIALSGKYGAGKTSILRTFFDNNSKEIYKPLYISLGMFGINKNGEIDDPNVFCQEIEKSIIQQIIYKEKPSKLPDSNIKRIEKLPKRNIFFMSVILVIFVFVYILNLYEINIGSIIKNIIEGIKNIKTLNIIYVCKPLDYAIKLLIYIFIITGLIGTISGISVVLSKIWRKITIKSYKLKLPNTELEISKGTEESLISKYMNELVYFFSKTDYNTIVIEDLDRFLENEEIRYRVLIIFQKLKELSIILNESKQVNRKIKFIYAVRDDLFRDETERTKFFDAIVPVIPVVSNFNSYAELKERLSNEDIPDKVIQDISVYINDYRLIKNLCNEYYLYKQELGNSGITNEKIFSMIALKNIRPNLYEELLNGKGIIYSLIKNKHILYDSLKEKLENEIAENNLQIKQLEKEKLENFNELKRLAVSSIYGKSARYGGEGITVEKFLQDSISLEYIKKNTLYIRGQYSNSFSEDDIFEYFNDKAGFIKRAETIQSKNNRKIDKLKNSNIQIEKQIQQIEELSLQEISKEITKINLQKVLEIENDKNIKIDEFVLMLISNGYIDENYKNYMFRFKETKELNNNDYTYIINVRQGIITDFKYKINNPQEVIKQLDVNYFGKHEILNYSVLEELITNSKILLNKEKLNRVITILLKHNQDNNRFVLGFLNYTKKQTVFLQMLYEANNEYFKELILYNMEEDDKQEYLENYIKILLNNPEILKNDEANKYIKDYVESKSDFEDYIELNENVQKALIILQVKFNTLQEQRDIGLISFVYNNNLYSINTNILGEIFKFKGYSEEQYNDENLTHILNDENLICLRDYVINNPREYIEECYLKTNNTKNEVNDIYQCLNEWEIEKEIKNKIIKNMTIQIEDINDIIDTECDECILENNRLKPTWSNIYNIYLRNEKTLDEKLINYIEINIELILNEKINDDIKSQDFTNFLGEIARNNDIEYEVYKKLIKIISYIKLVNLEENEIQDERLKLLVENDMVKFSPQNFNIINSESSETLGVYIKNNIQTFINDIGKYSLDEYIIEEIITSSYIKPRYKTNILEIIDISLVNLQTIKYIILNYSNNNISRLSQELKERILISGVEIKYKVLFLNKELYRDVSKETMEEYISIMPSPYNLIGNYKLRNKAFSIENSRENLEFLNKLKEKKINFTFKPSQTNRRLVINNKKPR